MQVKFPTDVMNALVEYSQLNHQSYAKTVVDAVKLLVELTLEKPPPPE